MTNSIQEAWLKNAPGRAINPDNAFGLQCVDVADDYAMVLFPGKGWAETIGGVGGAREFAGRSNAFFSWHPNVPGDLSSVPARGDLVVFNGTALNPYGHVAVVLSATAYAMVVVQQDGFLQTVAHVATLPYDGPGTGPCVGWLRPLVKPDTLKVLPNERVVGKAGVTERKTAAVLATNKTGRVFKGGDVLTFKGFERGQTVNGSNVWFVGAFKAGRFHSSAFDDGSTRGLVDLTPVVKPTVPPALLPTQRFAGAAGANMRNAPSKTAPVVETFIVGSKLNFKGWTRGERPYGSSSSDVWLVGISGGFIHSSAVVDGGTLTGLPEIKAAPAPAPAPAYSFAKRFACVTKVVPAAPGNFERGNFPARPEFLVVHQMDSVEKKPTLAGTGAWFGTPRPDAPSSAHFGAEEHELHAFVDTVDRAYHAGAVGNNYLSVEVPPNPSDATIETVKRLQREWKAKHGYALKLTDHRSVPGNATECGKNIPLSRFAIDEPATPAPAPVPAPVPTPAPVKTADAAVRDFLDSLFNAWKAGQK